MHGATTSTVFPHNANFHLAFVAAAAAAAANDILQRLWLSHDSQTMFLKGRALILKYKHRTGVIFSAGDSMNQQHLNTAGKKSRECAETFKVSVPEKKRKTTCLYDKWKLVICNFKRGRVQSLGDRNVSFLCRWRAQFAFVCRLLHLDTHSKREELLSWHLSYNNTPIYNSPREVLGRLQHAKL